MFITPEFKKMIDEGWQKMKQQGLESVPFDGEKFEGIILSRKELDQTLLKVFAGEEHQELYLGSMN